MSQAPYRIIEVGISDSKRVAAFLSTMVSGWDLNFCIRLLNQIWENNPFYAAVGAPGGWAIENAQGEIAGFIGNIPVLYMQGNQQQKAVFGTSWYVTENAREWSLKMYLPFTRQPLMIWSNTQTPAVEVVMQKMGFRSVPAQWHQKKFAMAGSVFNKAVRKACFSDFTLKKSALWLLAFGQQIRQIYYQLFDKKTTLQDVFTVQRITAFPADTDDWSLRFHTQNQLTLLRNRVSLQWLFNNEMNREAFRIYEVRKTDGSLTGFIIYKQRLLKGIPYLDIVDECLLPMTADEATCLLHMASKKIIRDNPDVCFFLMRSNLRDAFPFFKRLGAATVATGEKGYCKTNGAHPDKQPAVCTSVDGDAVFF